MERVQHRGMNESFPGYIRTVFLGKPVLANDALIMADTVIANGAQVIAAQPDCPRNLTLTVTDANASITAGKVTLVILDQSGLQLTRIHNIATDGLTKTFTDICGKIVSITVSDLAGNGGTDKLKIGVGNVIGFGFPVYAATAVKHVYLGGSRIASPTIQARSDDQAGIDASSGTYDGTKILHAVIDSEG